MNQTKSRLCGEQYRTTWVCVDSYDNSVFSGRFFNSAKPEGETFKSFLEFLKGMDRMLDRTNLPMNYNMLRTFRPKSEVRIENVADGRNNRGELATFRMRIAFRQNASWQGTVTWIEGKQELCFRSVLELAMLLDSALKDNENNAVACG